MAAAAAGHVFAFDKDPKRLKRLQANVARTGAGGIVQAQLADFLKLDPTAAEFKQVRGKQGWDRGMCVCTGRYVLTGMQDCEDDGVALLAVV